MRSTFITGFPRESQSAFENLLSFVKQAKLFNAGFFAYSREKGTPAYKLDGQIPYQTKQKRLRILYNTQLEIAQANGDQLVGKTFSVIAEGFSKQSLTYFGRAYFNAPDVDGKVYFFSSEQVENGQTYQVKITHADGYDLYGERV